MKVEIQIWGQVMPSAFVFAPSENFWAVNHLRKHYCKVWEGGQGYSSAAKRRYPILQLFTGENFSLVTATLMVAKDGEMYRMASLRTGFYVQRFDERNEAWVIACEVTAPTVEQIEGFLFENKTFILRRK